MTDQDPNTIQIDQDQAGDPQSPMPSPVPQPDGSAPPEALTGDQVKASDAGTDPKTEPDAEQDGPSETPAPREPLPEPQAPIHLADIYHSVINRIRAAIHVEEQSTLGAVIAEVEAINVHDFDHPLVAKYKADTLAYLRSFN